MKFSVFADFHFYPRVFMGGDYDDIDFICNRAKKEGAQFIIHAGDLCHGSSGAFDFVQYYNELDIPTYHVLGNHETDNTDYETTLRHYRMPDGHYYFDSDGYRIIALDTNYYLDGDKYVHYNLKNYYSHQDTRDYIPPEQFDWLKETLESSPYPCILISHSSLEREADGVKNQADVRKIINDANKKRPHTVILCINGHHHRDNIRILDNVCYFDLNSTAYDWVPKKHNCYPKELCDDYKLLSNTVVYNDPVHAVITLEGTSITIDGMESEMFMGINRVDTGNDEFDKAGRPVVPRVQSAKITLN